MWKVVSKQVNIRSTILGVLATVMVLSLMCSMSMQYGHADTPIAENAELVQPLGVGQSAPRFVVRTVDNELFEFDPLS